MIQIPGHHAPSFQIVSRQWVYYVAPHHWPTYNAQQNIHCDANKNHNEKTEKQVSSFVRVESSLLMAAIYWMICDIYKQQTCIRSEHVIRILLAFGHQGFPSSHHLWPEYCQPQLDTTVWSSGKGSSSELLCKYSSSCSHFLCKMFSPVGSSQAGGLSAASSEISDQMRGLMSWQTEM